MKKTNGKANGKIKNPVGPPKRGMETLPDGWEKTVYDVFSTGRHHFALCRELGMGYARYKRMMREEPEFKDVIDHYWPYFGAYWTELLRQLATGQNKDGNVTATIFAMKKMLKDYGFGDEVTTIAETSRQESETDSELFERVSKLIKYRISKN